ncbi:MAG TPA: hypothetical protein VMV69_29595 [Pirellulales bacterium]|nr:hypothetical protein [Pirellulales bacterium]
MSTTNEALPALLPSVLSLSRAEKLHLIELLANDLSREEGHIEPGPSSAARWHHAAFDAGSAMPRELDVNQEPTRFGDTHWMVQAVKQLQAIAKLPDGWDSNGAAAPDENVITSACVLLDGLALAEPSLPKPRIDPTPSGGIQFAWQSASRYFEIELIDPLTTQFYFVDRAAREEMEGELRAGESLSEVVRYVRRVAIEP